MIQPQLIKLLFVQELVSLESSGKTARIPVRICNLSARVITIQPNSTICQLVEAKAVDTWAPENETKTNESNSFSDLKDLGIKVNEDNLSAEQLQRAKEVLGNWSSLFWQKVQQI